MFNNLNTVLYQFINFSVLSNNSTPLMTATARQTFSNLPFNILIPAFDRNSSSTTISSNLLSPQHPHPCVRPQFDSSTSSTILSVMTGTPCLAKKSFSARVLTVQVTGTTALSRHQLIELADKSFLFVDMMEKPRKYLRSKFSKQ